MVSAGLEVKSPEHLREKANMHQCTSLDVGREKGAEESKFELYPQAMGHHILCDTRMICV